MFKKVKGISSMSLVRLGEQLYHITDYSHFLSPLTLVEKIVEVNDDRRIHLRGTWFIHLHRAMCSYYNTSVYRNTRWMQ